MYNLRFFSSLPHLHLPTKPQLLNPILKHNLLIYTLHRPTPLDDAPLINRINTASLPPTPALTNLLSPDAFLLAQQVLIISVPRIQQVAPVGDAEAPEGVQLAVLVDNDVEVPGAAELAQPGVCCGFGAVRDGDEVDRGVAVG
jgi:hypothetical protein